MPGRSDVGESLKEERGKDCNEDRRNGSKDGEQSHQPGMKLSTTQPFPSSALPSDASRIEDHERNRRNQVRDKKQRN